MSLLPKTRTAYFNGRFALETDIVIPYRDRSFNRGDGCFDMTRTFNGRPFKDSLTAAGAIATNAAASKARRARMFFLRGWRCRGASGRGGAERSAPWGAGYCFETSLRRCGMCCGLFFARSSQ